MTGFVGQGDCGIGWVALSGLMGMGPIPQGVALGFLGLPLRGGREWGRVDFVPLRGGREWERVDFRARSWKAVSAAAKPQGQPCYRGRLILKALCRTGSRRRCDVLVALAGLPGYNYVHLYGSLIKRRNSR